jgi:hypothetical protein
MDIFFARILRRISDKFEALNDRDPSIRCDLIISAPDLGDDPFRDAASAVADTGRWAWVSPAIAFFDAPPGAWGKISTKSRYTFSAVGKGVQRNPIAMMRIVIHGAGNGSNEAAPKGIMAKIQSAGDDAAALFLQFALPISEQLKAYPSLPPIALTSPFIDGWMWWALAVHFCMWNPLKPSILGGHVWERDPGMDAAGSTHYHSKLYQGFFEASLMAMDMMEELRTGGSAEGAPTEAKIDAALEKLGLSGSDLAPCSAFSGVGVTDFALRKALELKQISARKISRNGREINGYSTREVVRRFYKTIIEELQNRPQ